MRLRLPLVLLLTAVLLPVAHAGAQSPGRYVALGDSYASGEGNDPYERGTAARDNECHRSTAGAYPHFVLRPLTDRLFKPCSGATVVDLHASNHKGWIGEPAQLTWLNGDPRYVTLTIGGNDLGFEDILLRCAHAITTTGYGRFSVTVTLPPLGGTCSRLVREAAAYLPTLAERLKQAYARVLERAPNAQVRIVTYPPIFPDDFDGFDGSCIVAGAERPIVLPGTGRFTPPTRVRIGYPRWLVEEFARREDALNNAIVDAVEELRATDWQISARLRAVEVADVFDGRTLDCGDDRTTKPWISSVEVSEQDIRRFVLRQTNFRSLYVESFHPTREGQRAIARDVDDSFRVTEPPVPPTSPPTGPPTIPFPPTVPPIITPPAS
jgi:lysophospholipase L1-like esterase